MGFSIIVKGIHSHMVFLDMPLHVDAETDASKTALVQISEGTVVQN